MHVKYPRSHSCDPSRARHQMACSRPSYLPSSTIEFRLRMEKKLPKGSLVPRLSISRLFRPKQSRIRPRQWIECPSAMAMWHCGGYKGLRGYVLHACNTLFPTSRLRTPCFQLTKTLANRNVPTEAVTLANYQRIR